MFQLIINNQKGLNKVEFLFSVLFLVVMVLYSVQIFERQQNTVKMANQNIEIVTIVHNMRMILKDPENCSNTFRGFSQKLEGGEVVNLKQKIEGRTSGKTFINKFQTLENGGKPNPETGLGILSYSLSQSGIKKRAFKEGTFLIITFDRGINNFKTRREIKLYTKMSTDGAITECSLSNQGQNKEFWKVQGENVYITNKNVSIDTHQNIGNLNIKGPFKFLPQTLTCNFEKHGHIYFDSQTNTLRVCTPVGSVSLTEGEEISL